MADNYRERDALVGGTRNQWNNHATFELWADSPPPGSSDVSDMTWQPCSQEQLSGSYLGATPADGDDVQYSGPTASATVAPYTQ